MKKVIFLLAISFSFTMCNNRNDADNSAAQPQMDDPSGVQSASDAIPDSMRIQNDSVIIPDTSQQR